jgi:hypothetical protein
MKKLACILVLFALAATGCKQQYWIFNNTEPEVVAVVDTRPDAPQPEAPDPEPEPDKPVVEPETPKEVIYILGINGMD